MNQTRDNQPKHYWQTLEERTTPQSFGIYNQPEFEQDREVMEAEAKKLKLTRKTFLKVMGAGAVMAQAACRRPTEQIVPAVIQPPEIVPGLPLFYSTVSPDGTGLIVRTRDGRPIKIAGSQDHPVSGGGVTAYNVASLMDLYDADRLRKPVKFVKGKKKQATAEEIIGEIKTNLGKGSYVLLTGPSISPSTQSLFREFLGAFPGGRQITFRQDPTLRQIADGQEAAYGKSIIPAYRFDKAEYILSIDADFLGTMIHPGHYTHLFTKGRELKRGQKKMSRLVVIESMFSTTGSNADERLAIRPGDQVIIALSLAAQLTIKNGLAAPGGTALLEKYLPEKVASSLGVPQEAIERIAKELADSRGTSLVVGGSPLAATGSNASLAIAVNLLNSILGNDGKTIDSGSPMLLDPGASDREIQDLIQQMSSGKVQTVIVAGVNPAYHLPEFYKFADALKKVPYSAAISDHVDETAKLTQAVLPVSHYLESWGDAELFPGVYSVQQPVIRPLYNTKSVEDYLIAIAGGSLKGASSFHEFVKNSWQGRAKGDFRTFWNSVLQLGFYAPGRGDMGRDRGARAFNAGALSQITLPEKSSGLRLGLFYNVQVLDGSQANNAYRQELPDPVTKVVWENYAAILPATGRKLKLKQGSLVTVKTDKGSIELPVHLQPGLHADAVFVALGYGRTDAGHVANGQGQNAIALVSAGTDAIAFSGLKASLEPTGDRHQLANTQSVYRTGFNTEEKAFFAPALMEAPFNGSSNNGRPIIREATLKEYIEKPGHFKPEGIEYPGKPERELPADKQPETAALMKPWEYKGTKWHMVIDLNSCTGCGACVTSCNIENNIPMVGPEEVHRGREMHWLRIDRYYSGTEEAPEVAHQPMLCQHCDNAPCENVCPVAATTHSEEGLNVMTYNRCIGTRYCSNNCPYKVRRFNWFENWIWGEGLDRKLRDPMQLGLNPDVTVRSRGVMEKCTFCIQRINSARQDSIARGDKRIGDGAVVTACQEVCCADAISFGDINDPASKVNKLSKDIRGYQVLDFLGVKPAITYLAKIRNKA
ncbi:MAG: TAT-variant-translocated molybdopterin oxidoreductase [Leptospirales bacterium]|nr:TAT-variant-translocated molybdopterin oxidoreductase [Leptospirales bacterium]